MSVSILVVEDKERTRQYLLAELTPLNLTITMAKDGLDGLSKAKTQSFDMVLIDHKMPVMDGVSLLRNLRELETYKSSPLFFMTTQDLVEVEPVAIKAGATSCFSKPLNGNTLRNSVTSYSARSVA